MSKLRDRLAQLVRTELRAMLDGSVVVDPSRLYPVTGWYRTSPYADCYRWEGFFSWNGQTCTIDSWDRMTDCVRRGITIQRDGVSFEAAAR